MTLEEVRPHLPPCYLCRNPADERTIRVRGGRWLGVVAAMLLEGCTTLDSAGDVGHPGWDASTDPAMDASVADAGAADAAGCFPRPSGLVSWWRAEGTPADSVGPNDGTPTNVNYVTGMVGQAAHFSGDGYISAGSVGFPIGVDDRTIETWARISRPYAATPPAFVAGLFFGYGAWGVASGTYELLVVGGGSQSFPKDSLLFSQWKNQLGGSTQAPTLRENRWHHVAATLESGTLTLYLDGVITATGSGLLAIETGKGMTYVGGLPPAVSVGNSPNWLTGDIDEAAVYTRALGTDEIRGIFNAGSFGKCP